MKNKNKLISYALSICVLLFMNLIFIHGSQAVQISDKTLESTASSASERKQVQSVGQNSLNQPESLKAGQEATLSEFEKFVSGDVALTISTDIKQFGYDLFNQPPSTFAPVEIVPVGPGYVVGPGDEIKITIWGKVEGIWNVVVDRNGNVGLPKIGILGVTGLTFKEVSDLLRKEFAKYYTSFEINVSMGSLRTIRVYVIGNAERPGSYTLSSLSTLVNALFVSGGPSPVGTMRDIQLKRNGKTIVHFDMYDFLLKGDKRKDVRLMPEDVIFIPPVGALVGILGSVNTPAIFELKGKQKSIPLSSILKMAGGLSSVAFRERVQIQRIINNSRQVIFEANLKGITPNSINIQDGDIVKIFQVVQDKRTVRIVGAVQREGEYGFRYGMTLKNLISMAGGLKYYAYDKGAEITRVFITDKGPIVKQITVNLKKALLGDPKDNILLKEDDYLFVRTVPEWQLYQTITLTGEVNFPGAYTIRKGERLSSLLERAGGFTDKAYLNGAVFVRQSVKEMQQKRIEEMVDRLERELLSVGSTQVSTAASSDEARLMQIGTEQKRQFIAKLRTVRAQGRISILLDEPEKLRGTSYDIELEEGDSFYIPTDPNTVQVIGAVYNQTAFIYLEDKGYKDYIDLAGSYTENADKDNIYILKANGSATKVSGGFLGLTWNSEKSRWETGGGRVESGDTIVVPEKLEKIAWMRNTKDIIQVLYRIAVTTGILIATF